jgi:hypothetical protein
MQIGLTWRKPARSITLFLVLVAHAHAQDHYEDARNSASRFERWIARHKAALVEIQNTSEEAAAVRAGYIARLREAAVQYSRDCDLEAHRQTIREIERFLQEGVIENSSTTQQIPAAIREAQAGCRRRLSQIELAKQRQVVRQWRSYRIGLLDLERQLRASDDDSEADSVQREIQRAEVLINEAEAKLCRTPQDAAPPPVRLPSGLECGLVLHYCFDQPLGSRVVDASHRGNHGVIHGARRYSRGRSLGACWFDGVDDFVLVPSSPSLHVERALTVSVCLLWEPDAEIRGNASASLLALGTESQADLWLHLTSSGTLGAGVRDAEGASRRLVIPAEPAKQRIVAGTWNHVVFTYDGRVARTFVDGKRDKEIFLPGGIASADVPLCIGRKGNGRWTFGFRGALDDLLIWNRALTEVEILGLSAALKTPLD